MKITDEVKTAFGRVIAAANAASMADDTRSKLFDEYMGEPYGDEADGRSAFVSTDISDGIEASLPDLMDVFTASENIVSFQPVGPEDEGAAKQETEVANHVFWKMNDGFLILYTWIKEALTQQNSYTKQGWVEKTRVELESYDDLDVNELVAVLSGKDGEYEVQEQSGFSVQADPTTGQQVIVPEVGDDGQPAPIAIKIRCVTKEKRYEINVIPQEDFFVSPRWHSISLKDVPCCGHRREMEKGELKAMGFSEESIASASDDAEEFQTAARHDTKDSRDHGDDEYADESTEKVTVFEAYVRADINDDGIPELCRVWAIGDGSKVLQWDDGSEAIEEVDDHPFSCITPFPVPHRHVGRSMAELLRDPQRVKTVMMRHLFDNIYATNYQRPYFDDTRGGPGGAEQLYEDLLNPDQGAPIRTGGIDVQWFKPESVVPDILPILQMMDDLSEKRAGSTRYAQGLATEALNNAAASTVAQVRDWVTMKKMLIARVFAETGFKDLFRRIHKDMRNGPHRELALQLRGEWVNVNPRQWKSRTDLTVSVGMGTGDRDTIREGLMLLGQAQKEWMAAGMPGVGPAQLRHTVEKMAETYGIEEIGPFIGEVQEQPEQPPEEDPGKQAFEQQMQLAQMQIQQQAQEAASKLELERYKIDLQHQIELQKLALSQQKAVLDDDRVRDVEELKAASGFQRDNPMRAELAPPLPYDRVMNGSR